MRIVLNHLNVLLVYISSYSSLNSLMVINNRMFLFTTLKSSYYVLITLSYRLLIEQQNKSDMIKRKPLTTSH
jgi:hypothetical protein